MRSFTCPINVGVLVYFKYDVWKWLIEIKCKIKSSGWIKMVYRVMNKQRHSLQHAMCQQRCHPSAVLRGVFWMGVKGWNLFLFPQKQTQVLDEVLVMPLPILTLVLSSVKAKEDDSCWLQRTFVRICFKVLSKNQVPELRYFLQPAIACKLILKLHNQFEIS